MDSTATTPRPVAALSTPAAIGEAVAQLVLDAYLDQSRTPGLFASITYGQVYVSFDRLTEAAERMVTELGVALQLSLDDQMVAVNATTAFVQEGCRA